ncbi:hemin ABC transporter substrate-binding protein [Rhodobacteraceae bacterium B1Z28]|uniref:Hemin ABC transporter substrate-binding protein n=1 Tax=Ruegeria haliotis TaxID=2747601 RepID=A0ABX2PQ98_9RHOB|nr:hemin ABC transporter substrate-binding protein [Ruegeria haliotis]NVO56325.1 hemin ABC transporter substrate-binding protein [Ruegeria haliotis]
MIRKITALFSGLSVALILGTGATQAEPAERIVSAGGSITEIIYALGQEHRLVARDSTSNYPAEVSELPNIGYVRRLSAEGLLSVNPDLILAEEGAGPPETLAVLEETQIPIVSVPMGHNRAAVMDKIRTVAKALDVPEQGEQLADSVGAAIDSATSQEGLENKRVLFVLSMQSGRILAAGTNTAAQGIIEMVGATNVVQGFEGYKPLGDEAIITAAPDVILMMEAGGFLSVPDADVLAHPAIAVTPAGQNGDVLRMDGMLLLGFSVRTGQAITDLAAGLRDANG